MLVKQKIKYIQSLGQKKFRDEAGLFIAEGPKVVKELLDADADAVREVYGIKEWIDEHRTSLSRTETTEITDTELERISQLNTPNKVLALVQKYDDTAPAIIKDQVVLALDTIQDPGNLGTIIRIADWFGIGQIVCNRDSADIYNSKVVQATMGSIARVKVHYTELDEWLASQNNTAIYAASLEGQDITSMKKITEGIIVIGNESKGISLSVMNLANMKITIPRKGKAESLNAALATGIILSHIC